jgi:hypothetical protein
MTKGASVCRAPLLAGGDRDTARASNRRRLGDAAGPQLARSSGPGGARRRGPEHAGPRGHPGPRARQANPLRADPARGSADIRGRARRARGPRGAARIVERRWIEERAAAVLDEAGEVVVGEELSLGGVVRYGLEIARGGQPRVDAESDFLFFLPAHGPTRGARRPPPA